MKPAAFHPEAKIEFAEAAQYYASILPELGRRFHDEMSRLISEAGQSPTVFRFIREPARRHFTRNFPYGIIYVERPDDIWLLAVMHLHRAPGYWHQRLKD
ncbi:MAG: hypothetical protein WDM96_08860 [Lacunisphaera sp.]